MGNQTDWWREFFSGPVLDFVQHARDKENTPAEADFIQQATELPPDTKNLDVPCGGGRLSLELASRGYRVTGVDISWPLLEDAKAIADVRHLPISWEHRDMRDLPWRGQFAAAFAFGAALAILMIKGMLTS